MKDWVEWGAGPRASQYLILASKARAILHGRYVASVEDVKAVVPPILRHRIITNFKAQAEGITSLDMIERLLRRGDALNHFDPNFWHKVKTLHLRARFVVDGVMVGIHPSRAKGFSSEFEQHREYSQGEDVRRIDWKTYGKFDRYFIKEYREATNLSAYILLDASSSMGYASDGLSKFDYGSTLAASLAYLMLKQQDAVGLITFSDRIEKMVPPKAVHGYLFAILKELEARRPRGQTRTGSILQELAGSLKRRGLVILISDLLDDPGEVVRGLKQLRSKGNDLIVFHLLDRDELEFPFEEPKPFRYGGGD